MPEETLDLTKIHVDEYPKTREITKIIMDYLNNSNVDSTAIPFESEKDALWIKSLKIETKDSPEPMTPRMAKNNRERHIRLLLRKDYNGEFETVDEIYKKYNKDMAPEIAKLYRALISAQNDDSMDAAAYINVMNFLSVVMGYSNQHFDDRYASILINMINTKKIDEDFAYYVLSEVTREYSDISYWQTTFKHGKEEMARKLLKTLANMPQATTQDMMWYAGSLNNWQEVLKIENDADQKLEAQLKAELENVVIPDVSKIDKILRQWDALDTMLLHAKELAPDDKKAEINAERNEIIKKYRDNNWLDGNKTEDGPVVTEYDRGLKGRVIDAEQELKKAKEEASNMEKQLQEKDAKIADLMKQVEKLGADNKNLTAEKNRSEHDLREEREENNRLKEEKQQLTTKVSSLQQIINVIRGTIAAFIKRGSEKYKGLTRESVIMADLNNLNNQLDLNK